jgi:adenosine kinase
MPVLVCGSMAYDTIMVFHSQFKRHILPEQIHILNVSFVVPEMRREFGGCAGNVAYSLKLLGGEPLIMATIGDDAQPYLERLDKLAIDRRFLRIISGSFTAQAFITTDLDANQINAFHPGAMNFAHQNHIADASGLVSLGIVSPDGRDGMLQHARGFAAAGIPFVFDPGQQLPMFSKEELLEMLDLATWCTVNDYEARVVSDKTGLSEEEIAKRVEAYVVTLGANGSRIHSQGKIFEVPSIAISHVADPTGCGDAYRSGLLYGLEKGWDIVKAAQLASVMGAIKIEHRGGQNHTPTRAEIEKRFQDAFGAPL